MLPPTCPKLNGGDPPNIGQRSVLATFSFLVLFILSLLRGRSGDSNLSIWDLLGLPSRLHGAPVGFVWNFVGSARRCLGLSRRCLGSSGCLSGLLLALWVLLGLLGAPRGAIHDSRVPFGYHFDPFGTPFWDSILIHGDHVVTFGPPFSNSLLDQLRHI